MDNLIQFLLNEKEQLIKEEGKLSERIDKLSIENEQIEKEYEKGKNQEILYTQLSKLQDVWKYLNL